MARLITVASSIIPYSMASLIRTGKPTGRAFRYVLSSGVATGKNKVRTSPVEYAVHGKVYTADVPKNSLITITEYARKGKLSKRHQFDFNQIPTEQFSFWSNYTDRNKHPVFFLINRNTYYKKLTPEPERMSYWHSGKE